ncbi:MULTISPECIES: SPFH domain-containing protein [Kocuria]|uniref:SPFH domain-containing protein n=1 Tax=Kocuria TaxID=57493 RepID=UPI00203E1AEB|nr:MULTISPECIES: SPFH domain-containing protein [Kocuria]MCM3689359.1 SPFH/Band 7/PHB domain protein [Kocuria rosea]HST71337.1 SPFH domain-containing protein [Kocuria rosea]
MDLAVIVLLVLLVVLVAIVLLRSVRIIPQARAGIVERLGKYQATLTPGLHFLIPFVDRLLPLIDLREQVQSFPAQSVITEDNLVVGIDTVVYFQVTDPKAATYEIVDYIQAADQLTSATLRNVVGGLNLEAALTSRDKINAELRGVLDSTTGRWGIRVSRVDIKEITPPPSIQDSMEKQMRAERERRAVILTAEGDKQSRILMAEGQRQAAILSAEGEAKAAILRADGEAQAIRKVFDSIHRARPTQKLLAYQYIQTLPKVAEGSANKVWMIPAELGDALRGVGEFLSRPDDDGAGDRRGRSEALDEEVEPMPAAEDEPIVTPEEVRVTEDDLRPNLERTTVDPDAFTVPRAATVDPDAPVVLGGPLPPDGGPAPR